jgi:phosphoribosylanthranilate isomerase
MIVQIYEIQTPEEAERCIELGVDHIGSVLLSEEEWRQPRIREVIRLTEGSGARNSLIPLFSSRETLYRALDHYRPHFVHFCETLTDVRGRALDLEPFLRQQADLKGRFPGVRIIRSIPVPPEGHGLEAFPTLTIAERLEPVSDLFLTDTWLGREPVEGYIGITGRTGDRNLLRGLVTHSRIPVIVAGGVSPDNVYELLVDTRAAGADSCTRTNAADGEGNPIRFKKDFAKVRDLVQEARRAARTLASPGPRPG